MSKPFLVWLAIMVPLVVWLSWHSAPGFTALCEDSPLNIGTRGCVASPQSHPATTEKSPDRSTGDRD